VLVNNEEVISGPGQTHFPEDMGLVADLLTQVS
jgi:hypothetical protein